MQELIPKTFELLVLILLQPGVEFQDHTLSQSKIIELQKHPPQKIFSGQVLIKLRLYLQYNLSHVIKFYW